MSKKKLFMLLIVLLLAVALVAAVLVGCNPDGTEDDANDGNTETGDNTENDGNTETGDNTENDDQKPAGDVIFTDGVTLAEIFAALDSAESATYTYYSFDGEYEYLYTFKLTHDCVVEYAVENYDGRQYEGSYYVVLKDGVFYDAACENGEWSASKNLATNTAEDVLPSGLFYEYAYTIPYALEETDGKLQPKYGGELSLDGDALILSNEEKQDGKTISKEVHTLCLINATEATISADALERIDSADWDDVVYYNGIEYVRQTDGAGGFEYKYVYDAESVPENVTPETTINGFPVVSSDDNVAQPVEGPFAVGATLAQIRAAMEASNGYTYLLTDTRDGESTPDTLEAYFITATAARVVYGQYDSGSAQWLSEEMYLVKYGDDFFSVAKSDGVWRAVVSSSTCANLHATMYDGVLGCLTEQDGAVVPDEDVLKNGVHYVENSAEVVLGGDALGLSITYANPAGGANSTEFYTLKDVNSTTVTVPEEVMQAVYAIL